MIRFRVSHSESPRISPGIARGGRTHTVDCWKSRVSDTLPAPVPKTNKQITTSKTVRLLMSPSTLSIKLLVTAAICVVPTNAMLADEVDGSRLLPETTVGYFEFTQPGRLIDTVLDHPLKQHIQAMDVFQKATMSEAYRGFLTGRKFVELQIGSDWRPALEALTAGGIYGGFDSATNGAVLLVRGKDKTTMENFRAKILEMTRLRGDGSTPDNYRDISIYKTDNKSGAAVVRDWLIVTNNGELGKGILDRLLDAKPEAEATGTLSANKNFQAARSTRAAA